MFFPQIPPSACPLPAVPQVEMLARSARAHVSLASRAAGSVTPFPSCVRLRDQQVGNLPRKAWEAPQRYRQDSVKAHSRESQCSVHDIQKDTLDLDPAG